MIIHGPTTLPYDIGILIPPSKRGIVSNSNLDKGPIILSDWFHRDYNAIVADVVGTDITKVVRLTTLFA